MNKINIKKILKILLKIIVGFFLFILLFLFGFGFSIRYQDGSFDEWTGLRALFDKEKDFGIFLNQKEKYDLKGIDGPYLIDSTYYYVNQKNELKSEIFSKKDSLIVKVDSLDKDNFFVKIKDSIFVENAFYKMPEKLIAISDIEGNFNAFSSFLINNKVMDKEYNWIFGKGHLVLNGDFIDRGENVTQVLWLIYKLENQAKKLGGKVHYILGNHEIMNFQGRFKYNARKYIKVATLISKTEDLKKATQFIYSEKTELGKWLQSKNGIVKIGNYIFVHAGLSPKILKYKLSIDEINKISRINWTKDLYNEPENDEKANFLIGKEGIFWYRGLATDYKYHDKITEDELDKVLKFYQANKIVFGHTINEKITKDYNGKLINIDVEHGLEKNSEKTQGLLIEKGKEYIINGKGKKINI